MSMELPKRKSPRLQNFDYTGNNYYFVTICSYHKKCIFGTADQLNDFGKIVQEHIENISAHFTTVVIDKYVVMPNHLHFIVKIGCDSGVSNSVRLDTVVGLLKSGITKQIRTVYKDALVWQRSFHDHVIRNQTDYERIWLYIEGNPQKWQEDCFYICEQAVQ